MKLFFIVTLLVFTTVIKAQSKLEIEVTNLRNNNGDVALELVDENNNSVKGTKSKIENNKCTIVFNDIKNGKYAVRYFHDENSNEKVDKNFIGIPKEGCGFSNDAMGTFGPKEFNEWLFVVSGDTKITMETWYF